MKTNPELVTTPFATGDSETHSIPNSSTDTSIVTQQNGWQSIYSLPQESGGLAPERKDMNSIFYWITNLLFSAQKGWVWNYDPRQKYYTPSIVWDYSTFTPQTTTTTGTYTPKANGWFEYEEGTGYKGYVPTEDTSAVFGKTYYAASGGEMYIRIADYDSTVEQLRPSQDGEQTQWQLFTDYLKENIPVNDATLTLTKNTWTDSKETANPENLGTFTANQATDATIKVPVGDGQITLTVNGGSLLSNEVAGSFSNNIFTVDQRTNQTINLTHHVYNAKTTVNKVSYTNTSTATTTKIGEVTANQSTDGIINFPIGNGQITMKVNGGTVADNEVVGSFSNPSFNVDQNGNQTINLIHHVYNGTLTLQKKSITNTSSESLSNLGTFTSNQQKDAAISIPVGNGKITLTLNNGTTGTNEVSGSFGDNNVFYADQIKDQTINLTHHVYNGKLTVYTQNGSATAISRGTFTSNQQDDANITIPLGDGQLQIKTQQYSGTAGTTTDTKTAVPGTSTFTANQSGNAEITVPLGNAKTTLKFNNTEVGSWTANQYKDQTISITNAIGDAILKMIKRSTNGSGSTDSEIKDSSNNTFGFTANQSDPSTDTAIIPIGNGKTTFKCNGGTLGVVSADQTTDGTITIPNINNGVLTIQAGNAKTTFSANQSSDSSITIPYANTSTYGLIKVGTNLSVTDGIVQIQDSPSFTGVPKAPTASQGTATTQLATTAFVKNALTFTALGKLEFKGYFHLSNLSGKVTGGGILVLNCGGKNTDAYGYVSYDQGETYIRVFRTWGEYSSGHSITIPLSDGCYWKTSYGGYYGRSYVDVYFAPIGNAVLTINQEPIKNTPST